jgi:uncharacterized 2Fe-2S/4Fe-4S cluster protein (DUF4445 family)
MSETYRVVFQPSGRQVDAEAGQTLLDLTRSLGIEIQAPCGGKGTCGGCRVQIAEGAEPPTEPDLRQLSHEELGRDLRLACQTRVHGDMTVVIPRETLLFDQQILETGIEVDVDRHPGVQRICVAVPEPTVEDQRADAGRVLDALSELGVEADIDLAAARELPKRLRSCRFRGTAVVVGNRLVHFERGDTSQANYGVAVDLGTTTLVATLVNLTTGDDVAVASAANPQASRGDDVVSRIEYCQGSAARVRELHAMAVGAIGDLIDELCGQAGIKRTSIYEMTIVGNTTMVHLVLKLDVTNIAQAPFIAALRRGTYAEPRDLGLPINRRGRIHVGPSIAGFIGADTVGVILATGMHRSDKVRLAIDIGTNGELVIGNRDRLLACSTAAGPAFEGARIRYGMRASAGAIDRVDVVDGDLRVHTIGDEPALGLCGTGLIEAISVGRQTGIIDAMGRMVDPGDLPRGLAARLIQNGDGTALVLADGDSSGSEHPVLLTQKDVREVQLAKGAMYAGAQVLMNEFGVAPGDLDAVLLAGAFGNYIRPDRARCVGLLPEVQIEKVHFVGNAAGAGARAMLLDSRLRDEAEELSLGVEHVELSGRTDFQQLFAEAMIFPC